jgi:capsular polysaccharide biosynthesis protein
MQKQKIYEPNQKLLALPAIKYDEIGVLVPVITVNSLNNALITPTNHVFVKGKYTPTGLLTTHDDKKLSFIQQTYLYLKFRFLTKVKYCEGTYLLAHDMWSGNYYHWMCEALPRLLIMSKEFTGAKVIVPNVYKNKSYITESLKVLGLHIFWAEDKISYKYQNLVTVVTNPPWGNPVPELEIQLKNDLLNSLGIYSQQTAARKVFISRARAERRNIANENEIVPLLQQHGYEIVYCEDLSFTEQVKLFADTVSLISLHGAGLTNILFMPAGSRVLEIRDSNWKTNPLCYWWLANVLNLKWSYHLGGLIQHPTEKEGNFNNLEVNYESFKNDFAVFEEL